MFEPEIESITSLKKPDAETGKLPKSRIGSPYAVRGVYDKASDDDEDGSFNRALIQAQKDFEPPLDDAELVNNGQEGRFNFATGEASAIENEAISGLVDIYTTPKNLVKIPLTPDVPEPQRSQWGDIMAEEYTVMDRADDESFPTFLNLVDVFVTHGVSFGFFPDKNTMNYQSAGLDYFKMPKDASIIASKNTIYTAYGEMDPTDLWAHMKDDGTAEENWDPNEIRKAVQYAGSQGSDRWGDWEKLQRDLKANQTYVDTVSEKIKVIYCWVKEFNGKVSFFIVNQDCLYDADGKVEKADSGSRHEQDEGFLFKAIDYYDSIEQAIAIFPFSVGNGMRLYTVRGVGYLVYQLCLAANVLACKAMDTARMESSLHIQTDSDENLDDLNMIDFGGGVAFPKSVSFPQRQPIQGLSQSLIPAINLAKSYVDRSTGGISSGNLMLNPQQDRRTNLEVSSQLDFINASANFAVNLFYPSHDKLQRERVRRAFQVTQEDKDNKDRVAEMKERCRRRGVPEEAFQKIDLPRVQATRIVGTGSRASRVMIYEQARPFFASMDPDGRKNFVYDVLSDLMGVEKAERYLGAPGVERDNIDLSIAALEHAELLEGDYIPVRSSEDKFVHLHFHLDRAEEDLKDVSEGRIALDEWAVENAQVHRHIQETLEMTTAPEELQPELNNLIQRAQQFGAIVVNGIRMANKKAREQGEEADAAQQQAGGEEGNPEQRAEMEFQAAERRKQEAHRNEMMRLAELHQMKLEQMDEIGAQKIVLETQKQMAAIAQNDPAVAGLDQRPGSAGRG